MPKESVPHVLIYSYNPYESRYPARRVISREALHIAKLTRESGYSVVIEPDDGSKLAYTTEKGLDCNHITGQLYDGEECINRIEKVSLAETSLDTRPVQPRARIEGVKRKKRRKSPRKVKSS